MRKHPLIALIAFTFVAASIFIGANGVSSINNSVPARATSHLNNGRKWSIDGGDHQSQVARSNGARARSGLGAAHGCNRA